MSMSINAANYKSSTYQETWALEKTAPKDSAEKAGKVQQNGASASLDTVDLGKDGIAVTEASRPQGADLSASQDRSAALRMDTVEISEEGRKAAAGKQQTDTDAVDEYTAKDLSEYTDSELKQMYQKGEITRQEYEDETGESLD